MAWVRPGVLLTRATDLPPKRELIKLDFPTLLFPTKQNSPKKHQFENKTAQGFPEKKTHINHSVPNLVPLDFPRACGGCSQKRYILRVFLAEELFLGDLIIHFWSCKKMSQRKTSQKNSTAPKFRKNTYASYVLCSGASVLMRYCCSGCKLCKIPSKKILANNTRKTTEKL